MTIGIAVIGYGYWGPNLVRNFTTTPGFHIVGVADAREDARMRAKSSYLQLDTYADAEELIRSDAVDAVAIATPVSTHYALATLALECGKHVLVEKPLCATSEEAADLVARADRAGLVLMVDHTFLFTGAVQTIAKAAKSGELGKICYFDSVRVNLGLFQPDVNCLWDLAPHDLSIIDHIIEDEVVSLDITGYSHVDPGKPDMVYMTLHYANDCVAHFNLSWMSPVKVRRFVIGGTSKMLIWDDLDQDQKIKIYNSGIEFQPEDQRAAIIPEYRIGDIYSPRVPKREALSGVATHLQEVIQGKAPPIMDGRKGLRIVELLEKAQSQLDKSLASVAAGRRSAGRASS